MQDNTGQHRLVGTQVGNYLLRGLIGQGGMGSVFLGEHLFLKDRVAIKVLHGDFTASRVITERFFREAMAAREIGHPGVVRILDFGQTTDGSLYLVMELLEGTSLAEELARGALGEGRTARIGAALADTLWQTHQKGIIHRDLKPDNVFLTDEGVKILDFGIAKVADGGMTGHQEILGTPRYMAPEQARSARLVGPHSDIYSLGVILFQCLTGQPPFAGTAPAELIGQHLFQPPPRPGALAPVSEEMEALVLQCLEKDAARRPRTMLEVSRRLSSLVEQEVLPSAPTVVRRVAQVPKAGPSAVTLSPPGLTSATTLSSAAGEARAAGGRPWRTLGWMVLATAVLGVGVVSLALVARRHYARGAEAVPVAVVPAGEGTRTAAVGPTGASPVGAPVGAGAIGAISDAGTALVDAGAGDGAARDAGAGDGAVAPEHAGTSARAVVHNAPVPSTAPAPSARPAARPPRPTTAAPKPASTPAPRRKLHDINAESLD